MSDRPVPRRERTRRHLVLEAARGIGIVTGLCLAVLVAAGLLAVVVAWLF